MVVAFGGVPKFARWPGLIGMALNGFGSLRDSSSNFDSQKNFVFFVHFVKKNRTLISDLTQSNFKVLLIINHLLFFLLMLTKNNMRMLRDFKALSFQSCTNVSLLHNVSTYHRNPQLSHIVCYVHFFFSFVS